MAKLPIPTVQCRSDHGDVELGRQSFCRLFRYIFFCFSCSFFFFSFSPPPIIIYTCHKKVLIYFTSKMVDWTLAVIVAEVLCFIVFAMVFVYLITRPGSRV
ncbi:hypothetical protein EV426DRAFT_626817 [Tirmania nivea]|nr:hypothetical protein EV426DRAFT_626817 [Tirmania nivea]